MSEKAPKYGTRKRRASEFLAFMAIDAERTTYSIVAEGASAEACQRECTEAGREYIIARVHLRDTPKQTLLWKSQRATRKATKPAEPETPQP